MSHFSFECDVAKVVGYEVDGRRFWNISCLPMVEMRRLLVIVVAIVGLAICLVWLAYSDPQGEAGPDCVQANVFSLANAGGMSASSHTTICTALATTIVTYIYVHPSGQAPTSKDLIMRYSQESTADAPGIRWASDRRLLVRGLGVGLITKKKDKIVNINIEYE